MMTKSTSGSYLWLIVVILCVVILYRNTDDPKDWENQKQDFQCVGGYYQVQHGENLLQVYDRDGNKVPCERKETK